VKGVRNKRQQGIEREVRRAIAADRKAPAPAPPPDFDSLDQQRQIAKTLISMAAANQRSEKPDLKRLQEQLEAASRVLERILPYEHRRLATLAPAMEAVVKPDGSLSVTISPIDAEL
jgi:hypothetical protein